MKTSSLMLWSKIQTTTQVKKILATFLKWMFLIHLANLMVSIRSLDLDHNPSKTGRMPQERKTSSITCNNLRALFTYQTFSHSLSRITLMSHSCLKSLPECQMTQQLPVTGKKNRWIRLDSFTRFLVIFSSLIDQKNLEIWTSMKISVKLYLKNWRRFPNKHQEYSSKTSLSNSKILKLLISYRRRKLNNKKEERKKEQVMVLTIKITRSGHPPNGLKTKKWDVNRYLELYQYLSVSSIVKFPLKMTDCPKLLNLRVCFH